MVNALGHSVFVSCKETKEMRSTRLWISLGSSLSNSLLRVAPVTPNIRITYEIDMEQSESTLLIFENKFYISSKYILYESSTDYLELL